MEKIMWSLTERVVLDSRCGKPYICMIIKEPHDRAVIIIIPNLMLEDKKSNGNSCLVLQTLLIIITNFIGVGSERYINVAES